MEALLILTGSELRNDFYKTTYEYEEKIVTDYFYFNDFTCLIKYDLEHHFSGLPPPDNLYKIKALLQPSFSDLQIYLC